MREHAAPSARRVLVTGGAGLLGGALLRLAPAAVHLQATQRSRPVTRAEGHTVELSDEGAVHALFDRLRPELVFHTAYSMKAGERDIWQATRNIVAACRASGAELLYMSTDALLDGEHAPYSEEAEPAPVHEYGQWKARAEWHVREQMPEAAIIRTSLITSFSPLDPHSRWVADSLRQGKKITLYVDELRCPIAVEELARQLWELASLPAPSRGGIWHLVGPEAISRYNLGLLIAAHQRLDGRAITPAPSATSPSPRPRDLRLLSTRADQQLTLRARPISLLALPPEERKKEDKRPSR